MSRFVIAGLFVALATASVGTAFAEDSRTWEGTWNNKKYGTSGPLKCVATAGEDGKWNATFSGLFKGDPFSYDVAFDAKPAGRKTDLSGTATVSGHRYEWKGHVTGKTMFGEYRSRNGYFGSFSLKQK